MVSFSTFATASLALAAGVLGASSPCPYNYPSNVTNTTSASGLVFTVIANNPAYDNRVLQLIENPNVPGGSYVGVDNSSAVLLSNLRGGEVVSQKRNLYNQLYDLGPTMYLNLNTKTGNNSRFTVGFANASTVSTNPKGGPGPADASWYLLGGPSQGSYNLYHSVPVGVSNGFLICRSEVQLHGFHFWQLFYQEYQQTPTNYPNCESVGVRTTVSPTIINGKCSIAGFTAS